MYIICKLNFITIMYESTKSTSVNGKHICFLFFVCKLFLRFVGNFPIMDMFHGFLEGYHVYKIHNFNSFLHSHADGFLIVRIYPKIHKNLFVYTKYVQPLYDC